MGPIEELRGAIYLAEEACPGISDTMVAQLIQRLQRSVPCLPPAFPSPSSVALALCSWALAVCFLGTRLKQNQVREDFSSEF